MTDLTKYQAALKEFEDALKNLSEVLKVQKTDIVRDSAIKRFELVFDISWKAIKAWMEEQGSICNSPLGCFKEAYRQGLIEYQEEWIELVKTRNKTVHTYDQKLAEDVYGNLAKALTMFEKLLESLQKR